MEARKEKRMEKGTRFRVISTDADDEGMGVEVGDTGTVVDALSGDLVGCRMDTYDKHRSSLSGRVEPGHGKWLDISQIAVLDTPKPRKRHATSAPVQRARAAIADTSRKALQSQKDKAPSDCAKILAYIGRRKTGRTCDHVEQALNMSHQTTSARIRDLVSTGKLADSGRREATRTGRKAICWKAVG